MNNNFSIFKAKLDGVFNQIFSREEVLFFRKFRKSDLVSLQQRIVDLENKLA